MAPVSIALLAEMRDMVPQKLVHSTLNHSLLVCRVSEFLASMENAQVVGKLNVALVEVERGAVFFGREVQGIQCLGLGLSNGGNFSRSRETPVACKGSSRVLNDHSLRGILGGWLEV